ncbi:hypothetical protein ABMA27_003166 [Loxostege sticticalis]|uniref:Peptidase M14 domain-containing protein n=1 Tax=Loxostege sticticalis TaxID=481309 RepID=A0ABR3HS78_LOXSC
MLKLSNGNPSNEAFLVEAGLHGREWAAVLSVLYFIEHIAWNFTKQPDYIKNKDWYIIPVVNPEGYEYSMTKNRLWRKNRRTFSGPCDGVDLNRNFDTNWGTRDSSNNICAETFCGPQPFSEQETIAIRNVLNGRRFTGYVSVHSYGSAVLFPWIFDGRPSFHRDHHVPVAKEMVMSLKYSIFNLCKYLLIFFIHENE